MLEVRIPEILIFGCLESSGEKILNFRGLETKNFDFRRSGDVRGEKILNFKGLETENIDF